MAQATTASAPSRPPTNPQTRGERQETRCNDVPFAILFYANLVAMIAVAVIYGPDALDDADQDSDRDYRGYVYAALICSALGVLASLGGVAVMMCIPETLIKVALIFVVVMSGIFMVMMFLAGAFGGAILGLIFFAISICYARVVWPRIPFATANLVTAITAVRSNGGVIVYAFFLTFLAGCWSLLWSLSFVGVFDKTYECDDVTNTCSDPAYGLLFLLFVSYFFTHQVIQVSFIGCTERTLWLHGRLTLFLGSSLMFTTEHGPRDGGWNGG